MILHDLLNAFAVLGGWCLLALVPTAAWIALCEIVRRRARRARR
jgi:hypothetical protein